LIFFDLLSDFSLSPLAIYYIKLNIYRKSNIIFGKSFLDIYKCPFLKNENTFTKKKICKNREKAETIKIFKVWSLKKV
jgi:hypothetical protein